MALSYSDKNFTVIGNLCFVHIVLYGKDRIIDIPPAIVDRMLYPQIICTYTYVSSSTSTRGISTPTRGIGYAMIDRGKISLSDVCDGYLNFCFPIDSNK